MRRIGLVALIVILVGVAIGVTRAVTKSDQEDIFLEAANSIGQDPFTTTAAAQATTTTSSPATTSIAPAATTTTGLYGGSGDLYHCDPELLIKFLTDPRHRNKANAWIEVFNNDPTFRWGPDHLKTKLTVDDIAAYVHELTPTHLIQDTRVTNYGFKNGHATPHQALLQKGMAVMVDWNGVPRVKCRCGNPLTPPHKVDNPHYVGECWPGCHDNPPCTRNCAETTTTTEPPTTTSTRCFDGSVEVQCRTSTTRKVVDTTRPPPRTTTTMRIIDTTLPPTTVVRTTVPPSTSTTCSPNDPRCQ